MRKDIFEGEVDDKTEWFVADIVTNDLYWYVKDFVNIGEPSSENESHSSRTKTFTAGLSNKTNETKNNRIIVEIPESNYSVWIELFDNKK